MREESEKKGFLARIGEALYETVDAGSAETAPGQPETPADDAAPAAALPASADGPVDLAARLRAEIAGRGQAFSQFLALVASFAEIIPDESGRYRAAMKALEKTGNLTRNEVLLGAKDQLRALRSQREVFASTVGEQREALRQQAGGVEGIRAQITELQQAISRLQAQEQGVLQGVAAEEQKIALAEKQFVALLAAVESEIVAARDNIEKHLPG